LKISNSSIQSLVSEFLHKGFLHFRFDQESLKELRVLKELFTRALHECIPEEDIRSSDTTFSLEKFHHFYDDPDLNELKLSVIASLNGIERFNARFILDPLPSILEELLGKDLLIQKNVNLVAQRPGDIDNSELHSDFPGNSAFEIVIWIPFVDCDRSTGMFLEPLEESRAFADELVNSRGAKWEEIKHNLETSSRVVPVGFGEGLIFMTPLFHGSRVFSGDTCRFSINFRVKGLFSPSGLKDQYSFWRIFKVSEFTKVASSFYK
jgi:sporadic carbohydrate cluster 2OG-Fe(II) oxygenase